MSEQDLNAELQRLINLYESAQEAWREAKYAPNNTNDFVDDMGDSLDNLRLARTLELNSVGRSLSSFILKHRAALRIVPDAEPFAPPAWIAHVNSDAPRPDLDAG